MADRKIAVKFGTEGVNEAIRSMQRVAREYDKTLKETQQRIERFNKARPGVAGVGDARDLADFDRRRSQEAARANQLYQASFRELRIKSTRDLVEMRKQAVSAYRAIRDSGLASSRDLINAQTALNDRLEDIELQMIRNTRGAKNYGAELEATARRARAAMKEANFALDRNQGRPSAAIARQADEVRMRAGGRLRSIREEAFSTLGIRSGGQIERERRQLVDAFKAIKVAGVESATDIARAQRQLEAQMKRLDDEAKGQQRSFSGLGNIFKQGVKDLASYTLQATQFTLVFGAINATVQAAQAIISAPFAAAKSYGEFETQLKAIAVAGNTTMEQLGPLRQEIERTAPAIGQMPQETAAMAAELTRAGFTAEQTAGLIRNVGNAARGTNEDFNEVGGVLTNVIKQFALSQEEYTGATDVLVAGANASKAGILSVGEGLRYVGTQAAQSNQSLADTITVIAALTDVGLEGSIAGTSYGQALERMKLGSSEFNKETIVTTRGTKLMGEAIEELGVQFRDTDGNLRPVLEILPELRKALESLGQEDQDIIIKALFGTEGARAIRGLLAKTDDELKALNATIRDSGGVAQKASDQMADSYEGALAQISSQIEVLKIRVGEAFAPAFREVVAIGSDFIGQLIEETNLMDELNKAIAEFVGWLEQNPEIVEAIKAQFKELVRDGISAAASVSRQLLQYLKENPQAIQEAVKGVGEFVKGMTTLVNLAIRLAGWLDESLKAIRMLYSIASTEIVAKPLVDAVLGGLGLKGRQVDHPDADNSGVALPQSNTPTGGAIADVPSNTTMYGHKQYAVARRRDLKLYNRVGDRENYLQPEAALAVGKLVNLANQKGIYISVADAHRTEAEQKILFARAVQRYGTREKAAKGTAPPGFSEHHTGFVVDFVDSSGQLIQKNSREHQFIQKYASQFGLEQSFKGEGLVKEEPWHVRFVGSDRARSALHITGGGGATSAGVVQPLGARPASPSTLKKNAKDRQKAFLGVQGRSGLAANNPSQAHVHIEGSAEAAASIIAKANDAGLKVFGPSGKELRGIGDLEPHWDGKTNAFDLFIEGAPYDRSNVNVPVPFPFFGSSTVVDIQSGGRGGNAVVVREDATGQTAYLAHFGSIGVRVGDKSGSDDPFARFKGQAGAYNDYQKQLEADQREAERQLEEQRREERRLLEDARRRRNERLQQQFDQEKQELSDRQKQTQLEFAARIQRAPDAEKPALEQTLRQLELTYDYQQQILEIDQALKQLEEERRVKIADDGAGESVTGRDITAEINFLKQRKDLLNEQLRQEREIQQVDFEQQLNNQYDELRDRLLDVDEALADVNGKFADSPVKQEAEQIRQLNDEFDGYKRVVVDAIKATSDLIATKQAAGMATDEEIQILERLKQKYLEIQDVQNQATATLRADQEFSRKQVILDRAAEIQQIDSAIAQGRAGQLERAGDPFGAARVLEQDAVSAENLRFEQQLLDINRQLTQVQAQYDRAVAEGTDTAELESRIQFLERMKQAAIDLNQVNLADIKTQFQDLGETIEAIAADALTTFFEDIFTNTKSVGDAFRDMVASILQSIARLAAQLLVKQIFASIGFGFADGGLVPGYASGGLVRGPGTSTSDSIDAHLSKNEFVMRAKAVKFFGVNLLNQMNALQVPTQLVRVADSFGGSPQQTVVNQYQTVVTPDADSFRRTEYQRNRDRAEAIRRAIGG